jgi:hypothetical protein
VFSEDDVLSALDLAGLSAFEEAVSLKLLDITEFKVSDISTLVTAAGIPAKDALRFKKFLTDPAAKASAKATRDQQQRELEESVLREAEAEVEAQREREKQQRELEEAVLREEFHDQDGGEAGASGIAVAPEVPEPVVEAASSSLRTTAAPAGPSFAEVKFQQKMRNK